MDTEKPIIQLASPSNARLLAKLAEKTFKDAFAKLNKEENIEKYVARSFSESQIRSEILDSASIFFIAQLKDEWVGYAKLYRSAPPDCVKKIPAIELSRLYSMQEYLGCGIGPALLNECTSYARKNGYKSIWLGSWKKNSRGNAFYAKMKFEILGSTTFVLGSEIQDDYIFAKSII